MKVHVRDLDRVMRESDEFCAGIGILIVVGLIAMGLVAALVGWLL